MVLCTENDDFTPPRGVTVNERRPFTFDGSLYGRGPIRGVGEGMVYAVPTDRPAKVLHIPLSTLPRRVQRFVRGWRSRSRSTWISVPPWEQLQDG